MPPRPNVRSPSSNVRVSGPPNPVIGTPGQTHAEHVERRTQLELKNDEMNELRGRLEAVIQRNEFAVKLANEIRATLVTETRNAKVDQLLAILQAPI